MSTPLTKEARMRSRTGPAGACSGARIEASEPKVVGIITDPDIHVGAMHIGVIHHVTASLKSPELMTILQSS
jgi:hypothetical protein